jgi:hypothetical protein
MLKFTSVLGSDFRVITDTILTATIIRTGITRDLIIVAITARTIGTAGIVIIAIIAPTITGTNLIGNATPGWLEAIRASLIFQRELAEEIRPQETSALFSLLWRTGWFSHRAFAWPIDLEFFSQLLNECRYFLLPLCFDLLPKRLLDFSAFLNVSGFKPSAVLRIQLKTRVASGRVSLAGNNLPAHILPLTHEIALLRAHLHPKLRIALEILPGIGRHGEPAFPYALSRRCPLRLT